MKIWLEAFRLRTLPLAMASIGLGSFLAASEDRFNPWVLGLAALTAVLLQILSNLANDYGDSIHGADSDERTGPKRSVQTGAVSAARMRSAIGIFVLLSLASGITLLWMTVSLNRWKELLFFFALGIVSILGAMAYTMGSKPYGYRGLGDISVMLFFGIIGVFGTYYLHTAELNFMILLPALSCGFFSTAVLNVNNVRDIESDRKAGKISIPVRLGRKKAALYHAFLIGSGLFCSCVFMALRAGSLSDWLFLLSVPLMFLNIRAVFVKKSAAALDPFLKQMAVSTLVYVLTFGIGLLLSF